MIITSCWNQETTEFEKVRWLYTSPPKHKGLYIYSWLLRIKFYQQKITLIRI